MRKSSREGTAPAGRSLQAPQCELLRPEVRNMSWAADAKIKSPDILCPLAHPSFPCCSPESLCFVANTERKEAVEADWGVGDFDAYTERSQEPGILL